jgi:two-component system chemotaxis sensor kinase CheA
VPAPSASPPVPVAAAPARPAAPAPGESSAPPAQTASGEDPGSGGQKAGKSGATVRVDLDRIERLVNLVGELVINQAMLSQSVAEAGVATDGKIASGLDEFLQLTRDIQDGVMMIRAQPVKSLFQRLSRIVRESSDAAGKSARLVTEGEATEIDKTMIERLSDPLTHMIRNAVDHGLESPDKRAALGKPAEGTVTVSAGHRSGRVVIEVRDDGAGINRPKVQAIAEERGLIPPGLTLSEAEIDSLLFLPGFSTAGQISKLSGRGVGMDVVKNAIATLGGRIAINSEPDRGTTFSISLPLTLAVLDGMVIETGGETLVVPLNAIVETLTLRNEDVTRVGPSATVVRVRDSFVPLLDLAWLLGYGPARPVYGDTIALLISNDDGTRAALVVDRIVDQRQVVIKGLEDSYGRVPGVAAATILGDGRIALILDPSDLMARPQGRPTLRYAEAG